jgi:hypothetical protein
MSSAFDELLRLAEQLGIAVRHAHLGGSGGGLAAFKGKRELFIDLDAAPVEQLEQTTRAMARVDGLERIYLRADVRELIDQSMQEND